MAQDTSALLGTAEPSFDRANPASPFYEGGFRPLIAPPATPSTAAPAFDPTQPAKLEAPAFDPTQPAKLEAPAFDPSKPSVRIFTTEEVKAATPQQLADDPSFDPLAFGDQNPEHVTDPEVADRVVEAYRIRESRGTTLAQKAQAVKEGTVPALKTIGEAIPKLAKAGYALSAGEVTKAIQKSIEAGSLEPLKQGPVKTAIEAALSVELAGQRTGEAVRKSAREVREGLGRLTPDAVIEGANALGLPLAPTTPKSELTSTDWRQRYLDDLSGLQQTKKAAEGSAAISTALGASADDLKQAGITVDPANIEALSLATDPINYIPLGGVVNAVTKIGGRIVSKVVATAVSAEQAAKLAAGLNKASGVATRAIEGTVGGVGKAIEGVGNVTEKVVEGAKGTLGGIGLGAYLGHDFLHGLETLAVVKGVPKALQVGGKAIASPLTTETVANAITGGLHSAADAAVLTLPFEIGANEEEEKGVLGIVGVAGLAGAVTHGAAPAVREGARVAQDKLSETIFKHVEQAEPPASAADPYATDVSLDQSHQDEFQKLDPASQKLVNWSRNILRDSGGEVYVLDPKKFEQETGNKNGAGFFQKTGERVNPDGTSEPFVRILLNGGSSKAVPHEMFHALTALDPAGAKSFKDAVAKSMTSKQRAEFKGYYESLLNAGNPRKETWHRLTEDAVAWETAAEAFSRTYLAQDLSGVAPGVRQKAATFISGILEDFGSPLASFEQQKKGAGVSELGIRPSAEAAVKGQEWLGNLLQNKEDSGKLVTKPPQIENALSNLKPEDISISGANPVGEVPVNPRTPAPAPIPTTPAPLPEGVTPAAPTPTTAPNIRTTRAKQNDFAGQRSEQTGTEKARTAAEKLGDADTLARVNELATYIDSGKPVVELEHAGVTAEGFAQGRSSRRAQQELAYIKEAHGAIPESVRTKYQKVVVPYAMDVQGGKPQVLVMSLDKVLANASKLVELAADHNSSKLIPYPTEAGKLTEAGWNQFVEDFQSYAENQANGYRGDGNKLVRPKEDVGLSIPPENPDFAPTQITQERADFLNAVQGLNPPLTAREGGGAIVSAKMPGNVKGQILAEVNKRQPQTPAAIRPEDVKKQEFKSIPGRSIKETNPLRNQLAAAGVPVRELLEVTERINAKDIKSVTPRPDLDFKAPVTDTIRGGFMPKAEGSFQPSVELKDVADEYTKTAGIVRTRGSSRQFPEALAKEIADMLDKTPAGQLDPETKASYDKFNPEVEAQFRALEAAGYVMEPYTGKGEPYPNSRAMIEDVQQNKHLFYLPSESALGDNVKPSEEYPPLKVSTVSVNGKPVVYNDLFRAVHDVFGHATEGNSFSRTGEFNAWQDHAALFSDEAQAALAAETLAQVAWFNAGQHLRRPGGSLPQAGEPDFIPLSQRTYAPRRTFTLPKELLDRAANGVAGKFGDFFSSVTKGEFGKSNVPFGPVLDLAASVAEMTPEQFAAASKTWEGGLTKKAHEVGLDAKTPLEVKDLRTRAEASQLLARDAIKARDFTRAGIEGSRHQFFREAYEAATDTGSAANPTAGFRKSFPDRKAPFPGESFQPKTEAGKALADEGIDFQLTGQKGGRHLRAVKDGETVAYASTKQEGPTEANILMTMVDKSLRGQGIGQTLYREIFQQLKDDGVTKVTGTFIGPEPLAIRKKIFGGVEGLTHNGEPISFEPALKKSQTRNKEELNRIEGFNTITPESKFQPTMREMEESWAKAEKAAKKAPKKQSDEKPSLWILPDGSRAPLTTAYHESDLTANAANFNKKFGTDFDPKKSDIQEQVDALNKGFVRIRYTPEKGQLAIELNQNFWRGKTKQAVLDAVTLHEDKIDKITLGQTDDKGNATSYDEASVFKADDKSEALKEFFDGIKTVKGTSKGPSKGPSDIARMRSLPGDFQPSAEEPMLDLGLPSEEKMKQLRVKNRVTKAKDNYPEAVAPTYQRNEDGSYRVGEDGKGWTRGAGAEKSDFNTLLKETEKSPLGQLRTKKPQLDFGRGLNDIQAKK